MISHWLRQHVSKARCPTSRQAMDTQTAWSHASNVLTWPRFGIITVPWEFDLSWVYPFVWFCFNYELAIVWHHCSIDLGLLWDVEWNFMFGFCWTVCGAAAEKLCTKAKNTSIVAKCNLMWYPFRYMNTQYRMNATCTPSEQVQPMPLSLHGHVSFSDCLNICSSSFSTLACQLVKLLHAVTCEGLVDSVVECGGRRMLLLLLLLLLLANYFSKLYSPYLVLTYC